MLKVEHQFLFYNPKLNDTVEGASLALAIGSTVESMAKRGDLNGEALHLLLTMIAIVCHDAPVIIPWDKFFANVDD